MKNLIYLLGYSLHYQVIFSVFSERFIENINFEEVLFRIKDIFLAFSFGKIISWQNDDFQELFLALLTVEGHIGPLRGSRYQLPRPACGGEIGNFYRVLEE